ncbi:ribosomal L1 domain-containing protein 1-like isoform X1 [Biomphalaria glabrata]|uniref:Ribosomal L1 domain-containing protein 1 n=2 Tax=Biomphalaria glabrata TaxID=6526 RepID=A0A9U8E283_BIOGL|nr:ribosomal L1 domain-containing protein 1-like isoform X1 [Biomphalaria glabrata]
MPGKLFYIRPWDNHSDSSDLSKAKPKDKMNKVELNDTKVSKAIAALCHVAEKTEKKDTLLEKVDVVQMQICLKKIPSNNKTIKLKLPHSIYHPDLDVCLFVKDLDVKDREYEKTVNHFRDLFRQKGINCVTAIIPLKSLKTEYKPFEAKKNLSNAYDLYLADVRVIRLLPKLLGKHFYGRKKNPVQVNLLAKDLVKEIETAIGSSSCVITSKGASSIATVGHVKMSPGQVTENVVAASEQISQEVAGGANNIKQLNLKTKTSLSIPIYIAEGGPQDIKLPKNVRVREKVEAEELSTMLDAKVKVFSNGRIEVIREKIPGAPKEKKKKVLPKKTVPKRSRKLKGRK